MLSPYKELILKIDAFIRRYYKNLLLKGFIYSATILLASYLLLTVLEYYGQFNTLVRTILFSGFLLSLFSVLAVFIIKPLLGLFQIGKIISHNQAAQIIGQHFPEVNDKLLNTLQLHELLAQHPEKVALIEASILQRSQQLQPIPFFKAINLNANVKYLRFLAIPTFILLLILVTNAGIVTESTHRLVNFSTPFTPKAPFSFVSDNHTYEVLQNEDLEIKLSINGKAIPKEAYIEWNGNRYKMKNIGAGQYQYTFRNLQKDFQFVYWADGFYSKPFNVKVIAKPVLRSFSVLLQYPAYTKKANQTLENIGDLRVPEGTTITWNFNTKNTDSVQMVFGSELIQPKILRSNGFQYKQQFRNSKQYRVLIKNKQIESKDSIVYAIDVEKDAYPGIQVEQKIDSLNNNLIWFIGELSDDYGISKLAFHYQVKRQGEVMAQNTTKWIPIPAQKSLHQFYHVWSRESVQLKPGDELEYYFEVFDNDGINGAKATKSQNFQIKIPELAQIKEELASQGSDIKTSLTQLLNESTRVNKKIQSLKQKMNEKQSLTWQEQRQLDELMLKKEELNKLLEKLVKQNEDFNKKQNEFDPLKPELLKKQQELEKLMNELLTDEMKKMLEEMKKLLEEQNKDQIKEELDKLQFDEQQLNKELDRTLELYKKLELEKRTEQNLEKLEELSKKQENLAKQTEQEKGNTEQLKKEQEKLNQELEEVKEEFEDILSENQELENPEDIEDPKEELNEINQDMQEGTESLEEQKKQKAAQKQKEAAKKMKELAGRMKQTLQNQEQQQLELDYAALREILENLIQLSHDQEFLIKQFQQVRNYNPRFVELVQQQKRVNNDMRMVEDSLRSLAKRVAMISRYIGNEVAEVNKNLEKSLYELSQREAARATQYQGYSMTSMNNLAVLLSEMLKDMQDEMMSGSSGAGTSKPKKSKKGNKSDPKKMQQMQNEMGKQLKKMKEGMDKPGGSKPGSAAFAKMAAQQEAIRKMLEELKKELSESGNGKGAQELQKTINEMEKIEKDLVNKRITPETIKRIEEIETRMLEHERAEKEREQDQKRESQEAKPLDKKLPPSLEEYLKQKQKEAEMLQNIPAELQPYFREKSKQYFKNIQ